MVTDMSRTVLTVKNAQLDAKNVEETTLNTVQNVISDISYGLETVDQNAHKEPSETT